MIAKHAAKRINRVVNIVFIAWLRFVAFILRQWWKGIQIEWLNIFLYVGTIGLVSALPVWLYRWFGPHGLEVYFIVFWLILLTLPIAIVHNLTEGGFFKETIND